MLMLTNPAEACARMGHPFFLSNAVLRPFC